MRHVAVLLSTGRTDSRQVTDDRADCIHCSHMLLQAQANRLASAKFCHNLLGSIEFLGFL